MICLVIPCYNEEQRLPQDEIHAFLKTTDNVNLLLVNDGSTDKTIDVINKLKEQYPGVVEVCDLKENGGKAEAVRQGLQQSLKWKEFEWTGYWDADLATPLEEAVRFEKVLIELDKKLALGCRHKRLGIAVEREFFRHIVGRIFTYFANAILGEAIYDTQCGAKMFKPEIIPTITKNKYVSKWFFDIEILIRLKKLKGYENLSQIGIEIPLNTWIEKGDSKVKLMDFILTPLSLTKIYLHYRRLK